MKLGSGQSGGAYYALANEMAERLETPIEVIETSGTLDNLNKLANGELDAAIVQNDLAHYIYRGQNDLTRFTDFKSLFPLFEEYVQVVVRDNADISLLGDLRGKRVSVGPRQSGTYYNAMHILDEVGLTEGVDFNSRYLAQAESLAQLRGGDIDAAFVTGQLTALGDNDNIQLLILPLRLIQLLSEQYTYYKPTVITGSDESSDTHLSVTAYLVLSDGVSRNDAAILARQIIDAWPQLRASWPTLGQLEIALASHPIPYHNVVSVELARAGYVKAVWPIRALVSVSLLAWFIILLICYLAVRYRTTYNRLGETSASGELSARQRAVDFVARIAPVVIAISAVVITLIVSFWFVQLTEATYSRTNNIDNEFVGMNLWDGAFWLFSFVVSGLTLQDTLPQSTAGLLIANFMALVGIMGPVTLIFFLIAQSNRTREKRLRGETCSTQSEHVLICGWNEKAPGIIFSLTGEDVDEKREVTIIADCGDGSPIEKYNFDQRYVHYCQGDSSNRDNLKEANAYKAKTAIVLCDCKHREKGNLTGVLTVMNLRAISEEMHICAELAFDKNISHFVACGCNTLISPDKLIARMAVLSTVSPLLIDFIFDVLTYNKQDQFIAEPVKEVEKIIGEKISGEPAYKAHQHLIRRGANLVGLVLGQEREHGLFESSFHSGIEAVEDNKPFFLPLTTKAGRSTVLQDSNVLIFSARNRKAIAQRRDVSAIDNSKEITAEDICVRRKKPGGILLFGDDELATIHDGLNVLNDETHLDGHPAPTRLMTNEEISACLNPDVIYSHVILLTNKGQRSACSTDIDINEIDATTILNTRLLDKYFQDCQPDHPVQITVEALNAKNREMFKTAGATGIICSLTLVERFLTKEIYEKSRILDYVVALLNVTDHVHLYSFEVKESDGICGQPYAAILKSRIEGFRLIGWLPVTQQENLKNQAGDFEFHFRTVLGKRIAQSNVQAGDQLVVVLDRRRDDWLTRDEWAEIEPSTNNAQLVVKPECPPEDAQV